MHHHHHHHGPHSHGGWRRFEAMARRGFGGFPGMGGSGPGGKGPGDWGFGENFRIGRMLASGDLRLVALHLIDEEPRHGYDLIRAVEELSKGAYSPSPGIVYPALTFLEEAGHVTSETEGNKKLYTITEEGQAHLSDNRHAADATLNFLAKVGERFGAWREQQDEGEFAGGRGFRRHGFRHEPPQPPVPPMPPQPPFRGDRDMPGAIPELNAARRALKQAIAETAGNGEGAQRRIAEILSQAADDIRAVPPEAGADDIDL